MANNVIGNRGSLQLALQHYGHKEDHQSENYHRLEHGGTFQWSDLVTLRTNYRESLSEGVGLGEKKQTSGSWARPSLRRGSWPAPIISPPMRGMSGNPKFMPPPWPARKFWLKKWNMSFWLAGYRTRSSSAYSNAKRNRKSTYVRYRYCVWPSSAWPLRDIFPRIAIVSAAHIDWD